MNAEVLPKTNMRLAFRQKFFDYFALTKPTITLLVAVTVIPSLLLAAEGLPNPLVCLAAIIGASLASASAAVFNQLVETDVDVQMNRTKNRALASGRVTKDAACLFGLVCGVAGLFILYKFTFPLAALVALAGHLFYVLVYTVYLKKRTEQNIVIGGAAGAVGPLIGWAAITGSLPWPSWVLFGVIFLWTPPHFWALALKYKDDYAEAGIPMYPVIHGDEKTKRLMFLYTLTLIPCIFSLYVYDKAGLFYLVCSAALTFKFAYDAFVLYRSKSNDKVMPLFHFSCLYVFGIFGSLTLDRILVLF